MHGGFVTLLIFMGILGIMLTVAAYQAVSHGRNSSAAVRTLKVVFAVAYCVTVVFLGLLFEGMTQVDQYECTDQGTPEVTSGYSAVVATSNDTSTPTYVQKFNYSRLFILRSAANNYSNFIRVTTGYEYNSAEAAIEASNNDLIPMGQPLYLKPSDADTTDSFSSARVFLEKLVDMNSLADLKNTGAEGSKIAGSIASGVLGLALIYGIVEYYLKRRSHLHAHAPRGK